MTGRHRVPEDGVHPVASLRSRATYLVLLHTGRPVSACEPTRHDGSQPKRGTA